MQDTSFFDGPSSLPITAITPRLVIGIEQAWAPDQWCGVHVLLAVSGGADSVALLRAMLELKQRHGGPGQLHAAHLNHGLRQAEADHDQRWVAELCLSLGVQLWSGRTEITEPDAREGWEAAARSARYEFLTRTAEQIGARFVVTAHTADDQAETVLHRVLRGTGIEGLAGIPFSRPLSPSVTLIRPMLGVTRAEVVGYLDERTQSFRTDSSNASSRFTRNWLRNDLLPAIRDRVNPEVDGALLRLSQQARETQQVIANRADRLIEKYAQFAEDADICKIGALQIECSPLRDEAAVVVRELCKRAWQRSGWPLRDMGYDQWQQLAQLVQSADGPPAVMLPGGMRAEASGGFLVLRWADPR